MSQNDFVIADQSAVSALNDINSALQALASCSSGASEPATKYANQLWYDTTANILKLRNEANSAWISIGYFDQSANAFRILDNTQVVNTSGVQTGLLGDQATTEWQSGTGNIESLVSPAKIKAAIQAASPNQTWANFNGTGTISVRANNNVSSITDLGIGDYRLNFASSLTDANYAVSGGCTTINDNDHSSVTISSASDTTAPYTMTSSAVRFRTGVARVGNVDFHTASVVVKR